MPNLIDDVLGYEIETEIEWSRQELHILILGAYRPENAKKRLERLRNCLIERGYSNTYLVADYPDNNKSDEDWNIYWERKSNELMLHSDLNLFVFFADGSNEGVTDELAHFCCGQIDSTQAVKVTGFNHRGRREHREHRVFKPILRALCGCISY